MQIIPLLLFGRTHIVGICKSSWGAISSQPFKYLSAAKWQMHKWCYHHFEGEGVDTSAACEDGPEIVTIILRRYNTFPLLSKDILVLSLHTA